MNIEYVNQLSVTDFNNLRKDAGWKLIEVEQALRGIQNSAFIIAALHDEKVVGFARVISDSGYVIIIAEVAVLSEYRGKGIGTTMMQKVMEFINDYVQEGQHVIVGLFASTGKEGFYEKFGFETRPNKELGAGMSQFIYHKK